MPRVNESQLIQLVTQGMVLYGLDDVGQLWQINTGSGEARKVDLIFRNEERASDGAFYLTKDDPKVSVPVSTCSICSGPLFSEVDIGCPTCCHRGCEDCK